MSRGPLRIALIDNYDSYSYNLVHLLALANQGVPPSIFLSDAFSSLGKLEHAHGQFNAFILSPGPGNPTRLSDFSQLQCDILSSSFPVFAICLGHQALCHLYGSSIDRILSGPAHGIISQIFLSPAASTCPLFKSLPSSFYVVRYHSLVANPDTFDSSIYTTAWTEDSHPQHPASNSVVMAVRHRSLPHFGLQFHPESVCSQYGDKLASNFVGLAYQLRRAYSCPRIMPTGPASEQRTASSPQPSFNTLVRNIGHQRAQPFSVFSTLFGQHEGSFWLDSGVIDSNLSQLRKHDQPQSALDLNRKIQSQQNARFSIMGSCDGPNSEIVKYEVSSKSIYIRKPQNESNTETTKKGCIFDYVKEQIERRYSKPPAFLPFEMNGGYVGYFGYELKQNALGVQKKNRHKSDLPDAWLVFADQLILFDHETEEIFLVALVPNESEHHIRVAHDWFDRVESSVRGLSEKGGGCIQPGERWGCTGIEQQNSLPLNFVPERSREDYLKDISRCLQVIQEGESYEVCLTNRLRTSIPQNRRFDPLELYGTLRTLNPAPYSAFLNLSETEAICCSSPERYLTISSNGKVESKPIKGTRRRGRAIEEDEELRNELRNSSKDRSENLMIVDLVRNDLSRTCEIGSVQVPKLMHVESYASVHQLVSTVTGNLKAESSTVDCVKAAYPMGSMTGAPKIRTMEIIDSIETSARGVYSGTIGYVSVSGAADLNVVIRTAVIRDREIEIGAGGAIVSKSCPQDEYDETILKGRALMQAVALYFTGDGDAFIVQH